MFFDKFSDLVINSGCFFNLVYNWCFLWRCIFLSFPKYPFFSLCFSGCFFFKWVFEILLKHGFHFMMGITFFGCLCLGVIFLYYETLCFFMGTFILASFFSFLGCFFGCFYGFFFPKYEKNSFMTTIDLKRLWKSYDSMFLPPWLDKTDLRIGQMLSTYLGYRVP